VYDTIGEIRALLGIAEESATLDFKSGRFFQEKLTDDSRKELVKDATSFANAGGGTIIYGISEKKVGGKSVADKIEPVPSGRMTDEQLTQLLNSNTDPPLRDFKVKSIPVRGGIILVLQIGEGHTAFQNLRDKLFYQRVGATTSVMLGFQIRDVMNRRTTPIVTASLPLERARMDRERHVYNLAPCLENQGFVTAHHWTLWADLPIGQLAQHSSPETVRQLGSVQVEGQSIMRFEYSSERAPVHTPLRLLPGEKKSLANNQGFALVTLTVTEEAYRHLEKTRPPLRWLLFVDNARSQTGIVSYKEWCLY
jgi:hypothetical protein